MGLNKICQRGQLKTVFTLTNIKFTIIFCNLGYSLDLGDFCCLAFFDTNLGYVHVLLRVLFD